MENENPKEPNKRLSILCIIKEKTKTGHEKKCEKKMGIEKKLGKGGMVYCQEAEKKNEKKMVRFSFVKNEEKKMKSGPNNEEKSLERNIVEKNR